MTPSIILSLAGLFISVAGALVVLIWRAGVMLGKLEARLERVEGRSSDHHSFIKELRGKLDSTHDVAIRAELKSSHNWSEK
jgi:hypothetical protein